MQMLSETRSVSTNLGDICVTNHNFSAKRATNQFQVPEDERQFATRSGEAHVDIHAACTDLSENDQKLR